MVQVQVEETKIEPRDAAVCVAFTKYGRGGDLGSLPGLAVHYGAPHSLANHL